MSAIKKLLEFIAKDEWHFTSEIIAEAKRLGAEESNSKPETSELEMQIREFLWLNHGHNGPALYGDVRGEMQCKACMKWDYLRTPLKELLQQLEELKWIRAQENYKRLRDGKDGDNQKTALSE